MILLYFVKLFYEINFFPVNFFLGDTIGHYRVLSFRAYFVFKNLPTSRDFAGF